MTAGDDEQQPDASGEIVRDRDRGNTPRVPQCGAEARVRMRSWLGL